MTEEIKKLKELIDGTDSTTTMLMDQLTENAGAAAAGAQTETGGAAGSAGNP